MVTIFASPIPSTPKSTASGRTPLGGPIRSGEPFFLRRQETLLLRNGPLGEEKERLRGGESLAQMDWECKDEVSK